MASFNRIIIVGYLGRAPESKFSSDGTAVCNFSVATSEKRKDRKGDLNEQTTWFKVSCFGKTAELCQARLAKGAQVYVEGKLRLDEYTDRNGERRAVLEVTASDVKFLSAQGEAERQEQPQARATATTATSARGPVNREAARAALKAQAPADFDDDDIPF